MMPPICPLPAPTVQPVFSGLFGRPRPVQVGVYLGSFNHIHNGHLQLARQARDQLKLDAVEIVPLATPFHKPVDFIPEDTRYHLAKLATQREPRLTASRLDIEAKGPTLKDFVNLYPPAQAKVNLALQRTLNLLDAVEDKYQKATGRPVKLNYIVGADGLAGYPQAWKEPRYDEFLRRCRLLIAPRPGAPLVKETVKALRALHPHLRYKVLNVVPSNISSTQIRSLMRSGQPIVDASMPPAVAEFLNRNAGKLLPPQIA
jgi:nicotinate-nucleotide adenylyltransferase